MGFLLSAMPRLPSFSGRPVLVPLEDAVGVVGRDGLSLPQQFKVIQEGFRHQFLGDESVDDHGGSDDDAVEVLAEGERDEHEGPAADLHDDDLQDEDACDDEDEEVVVEEVLEDVEFLLLELARVEEVEDLQEDEHVEEDAQVLPVGLVPVLDGQPDRTRHSEHLVALEQHQHQHHDLVDRAQHYSAPHLRVYYVLSARVGHAVEQVVGGRLGGEGEGGQRVHDEVDPEHLDGGQRRLLDDHCAEEGHEDGHDVDRQLELQELADAVEDVAAVLDRSDDGAEVVVQQDDARRLLRHLRPRQPHREPDVRLLQRRRVVGAVASHGHHVAELLQPGGQDVLVLGGGAREHPQFVSDLPELLDVLHLLLVLLLVLLD
jgi:hypothetical protein